LRALTWHCLVSLLVRGQAGIGCSDFETNRAFVWTIEAARFLAGGMVGGERSAMAITLLKMASEEIASFTERAA
jgi:hypothetical protein